MVGFRDRHALLVFGIALFALTACKSSRGQQVTAPNPQPPVSRAPRLPFAYIKLETIGHLPAKGRVQDQDYSRSNLPVIDLLLVHDKDCIPYLISKLTDETKIDGHVIDYWNEVGVGDVALIILTNFFTDRSMQSTLKGFAWDEFLERGTNDSLSAEELLRNYVAKHSRKEIQARWQQVWTAKQDRIFWDEAERCFRLKTP